MLFTPISLINIQFYNTQGGAGTPIEAYVFVGSDPDYEFTLAEI